MNWTTRIVLGFVVAGEVMLLPALMTTSALQWTWRQLTHGPAAPDLPTSIAGSFVWGWAQAWRDFTPWLMLVSLFGLLPMALSGYAYARLMQSPPLGATRSRWARAAVGAAAAFTVTFAFYVVAHWWNLSKCAACNVPQHFPPERIVGFALRFLEQLGVLAAGIGAVCALVCHGQSWQTYTEQRGLEVGQFPREPPIPPAGGGQETGHR